MIRQRRWHFSARVLVPALASLLVTAAAVFAFVLWSTQDIDRLADAHESALAAGALQKTIESVPRNQQSVTIWDDAIQNAKFEVNKDWLDNNLGVWMASFYGIDQVFVLNEQDLPVYSMDNGTSPAEPGLFQKERDLIAPRIAELRKQIAAGALNAYAAGTLKTYPRVVDLVEIDGQPTVLSIEPITSDSGKIQQPAGSEYLHVAMWKLDQDVASQISQDYRLDAAAFSLTPSAEPQLASSPIVSDAGRIAGFFQWKPSRPGTAMMYRTLPILALAFAVAGLLVLLLVRSLWSSSRELEVGRAAAHHQSLHDPLTGLPNRINFEAAVARALAQRPTRERRVSVMVLDLDRFKRVNDTLGHSAGDQLLEAVGQRLAQFVGEGEIVARLGGDEFAIVHLHGQEVASMLLSQGIIEAVAKPFDVAGSEVFIGVSIGIATADGHEADAREVIRKADIALYEAKTTGRNRAVVFEESMNELLQNRHTIEAELRDALRRTDQLSVDFQPLFDAGQTRILGAEALARWRHPRLGQVSPAHFIPVAEQSGLISDLGDLVLRRACEVGAKWPGHLIAVNISPAQLRDPRFPERVFKLLADTRMPPTDLELEITEGILLEDSSISANAIRVFRSAGIRIALDDFGTGYSSLNYLKRYPVDRIKIDRSFVSQLAVGSVSVAIVQAMVTLAHALKIEVTAEGVETSEQMDVLTDLGCNVFQGFLLSPPVAQDALETLFRSSEEAPELHACVA